MEGMNTPSLILNLSIFDVDFMYMYIHVSKLQHNVHILSIRHVQVFLTSIVLHFEMLFTH